MRRGSRSVRVSCLTSFLCCADGDVDCGVREVDVEGVAGEGEGDAGLCGADFVEDFVEQGAETCRAYAAGVGFVAHTFVEFGVL